MRLLSGSCIVLVSVRTSPGRCHCQRRMDRPDNRRQRMSGHFAPVPNHYCKRLLILALTAPKVKSMPLAEASLVVDRASGYNARHGCGTHGIATDARRPPWHFAPRQRSGRTLAALLCARASYAQCFPSLASHRRYGRGSSALGRRMASASRGFNRPAEPSRRPNS